MTDKPAPAQPPAASRALIGKLLRYGQVLIGPVSVAGSQLLLALLLLKVLPPAEFGAFSLLIIAFQFASGLWSALFCAPLPAALAGQEARGRAEMLRAVLLANLLLALVATVLFVLIGTALGLPWVAATLFAAYAGIGLVRWFARARAYVEAKPLRATASDAIYGIIVLAGCAGMWLMDVVTVVWASTVLLAAATLGGLPFLSMRRANALPAASTGWISTYGDIWRRHARWSVVGVVSTEATVNAHAYVVTLLVGPASFAPLAASALLLRPLGVIMNALIEFERPHMARQMAAGGHKDALRSAALFRLILIAAWCANVVAAIALLALAPQLVFPAKYPFQFIAIGSALWFAVGLVRLARLPESALLQAAGRFRLLAGASVYSSVASVGAVVALVILAGPLWSIAGVLFGELVFASFLWRAANRWKRQGKDMTGA
jgi:hypothetical protein